MGQTNVKNLGNGGTMDGDVTITGDLTVSGGIALTLSEVLQGTSTIDVDSTEALLVRKNGDGGDILTVDTTNSLIKLGKNGGTPTGLNIYGATNGNPLLIYEDTDNSVVFNFYLDSSDNSGLGLYANGASQKVNLGTTASSPTYFTGGSVGIGTATPQSFDSEANNLVIGNGSGDNGITIFTGSSAGDYGSIFFGDATGTPKQGQIRYEQNNEVMSFFTNTAERMRINLNGDVGIGLTTPDVWSYSGTAFSLSGGTTANNYVAFNLGAYSTSTTGIIGDINFTQFASDGTTGAERAIIRSLNDGALDSVALKFYTTPTGGAVAERMVIKSDGKVLIGKTSSAFGTAGTEMWGDGTLWATKAGGNPVGLNRTGSAGSVLEWYDDSAIKGVLGTATSYFLNNVGIGVSSPQAKLTVEESTAQPALVLDQSGQQQLSGIRLRTNRGDTGSVDDNWDMYTSGDGALRFAYLQSANDAYPNLNTGHINWLAITGAGNVGIGSQHTSPYSPLHVKSSAEGSIGG